MRIVAAYYTHKPGGFCKRLYRLLNALAVRGNDVFYLSLDEPPKGALLDSVHWRKIPFHTHKRRGLFFWATLALWLPLYLVSASRAMRPERILTFGAIYSALFAPAALLAKAPIILFMRSLAFRIDEITGQPAVIRLLSRTVERFGLRRANRIVAMTKVMGEEISQFAGPGIAPILTLPNDLPTGFTHSARSRSPHTLRLGTAGVLDARKNISLLLQALQGINSANTATRAQLIIAGAGPLREGLERESRELGVAEFVSFLGWQESLAPFLDSIELYVHPSLHEGVSNAVLEALSAGLPVLLADTPESREIFQAPELLFASNSPESLANRLIELASDSQALARLQFLSSQSANRLRFDWDESSTTLVTSAL